MKLAGASGGAEFRIHLGCWRGGGTTEYALDAISCAAKGIEYECPVPVEVLATGLATPQNSSPVL